MMAFWKVFSLFLVLVFLCASCLASNGTAEVLTVRVSQKHGVDDEDCLKHWNSSLAQPCRSLGQALLAVSRARRVAILILDEQYSIERDVLIANSSMDIIVAESLNISGPSELRCARDNVAVYIGTEDSNTNITISLQHLTFTGCGMEAPASLFAWNCEDLRLKNCTFRDNHNAGFNAVDSSLRLTDCLFRNNTSNVNNTKRTFRLGRDSMGGGLGLYFTSQTGKTVEVSSTSFVFNRAAYFSSTQFVAPSRNSSHVEQGGGGVVIYCSQQTQHVHVSFTRCEFTRNMATYGGGICTVIEGYSSNNSLNITDSHFIENDAGQVGGGISLVLIDSSNTTKIHVQRSTFKKNGARFAGGVNIFLGNKVPWKTSVMRFSEVLVQGNFARDFVGSAIRIYSTAPFGAPLDTFPEFNNCNFTDHAVCEQINTLFGAIIVRKSELNFTGFNYFTRNTVAGALFLEQSSMHVHGKLVFEKNKGRFGGAINLQGSKIILYPHCELSFLKNSASSVGGALAAVSSGLPDLVHEYNPGCFLAYSEECVPHSQWKVSQRPVHLSQRSLLLSLHVEVDFKQCPG